MATTKTIKKTASRSTLENDLLLPKTGTSYKVAFSEPPALKDPFTRSLMKMLQEMNTELENETLKSAKLQQKLTRFQSSTGMKSPGSVRRLPSPGSTRRIRSAAPDVGNEGGSIRRTRSPGSVRRLPIAPGGPESPSHLNLDPSSAMSLSRTVTPRKKPPLPQLDDATVKVIAGGAPAAQPPGTIMSVDF